MFYPPPLGNQRWKETYSLTEVTHMFKVKGSTIRKVAKRIKCGITSGYETHFNLDHLEKLYGGMTPAAQKRYDSQFKK